jgi:hypothetical protein
MATAVKRQESAKIQRPNTNHVHWGFPMASMGTLIRLNSTVLIRELPKSLSRNKVRIAFNCFLINSTQCIAGHYGKQKQIFGFIKGVVKIWINRVQYGFMLLT